MLKDIADDVTVALAANDIISIDEMDAYRYGLELLIPKAILYAAILIISLITNTFILSVLFVTMFMGVRRYSGGFHCQTAEMCLCISFLIYLLVIFGFNFSSEVYIDVYCVSSVVSAITIIIFSPVEDKNRPLDDVEKKQYRLKSLIATGLVSITFALSFYFKIIMLSYISACSLTANAVLIILAVGRCKYEKFNIKSCG